MVLVDNYILAILCCAYCCLCWGSWANTQKMVASKSWSFELFYWDLTIGLFLTALLGAVTLGSLGSEGRTVLVPDVDVFPGHIACSSLSRSEVVVPLRKADGGVWGVLDIDSNRVADFDEGDVKYLEEIACLLTTYH